ncbi:uncharacterized protein LOC101460003 [Ceratitis capitata]|nr:uncharacterized protein LOC101460003 [Ceratitis capitata]
MSVNITVNGKFRACNNPSILDDPVRVKKQLESDLRKQRLLEVREESKKLARRIRDDVAEEKERQLRNLEAIKAKELECWRQHILDQKDGEYRQAIFQIGAAHNAAKIENEAMAERLAAREKQSQKFKRKTNERLGYKTPQKTKKVLQTAGTQTPNILMKDKKKKSKKFKRKNCSKNHNSMCQCSSAESDSFEESFNSEGESKENEEKQSDTSKSEATKSVKICPCPKVINCPCTSSSSCSSLLSSTSTDEEETEKSVSAENKNVRLSKNPPIIVDIDVASNDSISIRAGEIKDKFTQSNRQFSHIVRASSPEKPVRSSLKESTTVKAAKPRFTQVSQLINNKGASNVRRSSSPSPPKAPPPSLTAASRTSTLKSPYKSTSSGHMQTTLVGNAVILDSCNSDKTKDDRDSGQRRVQSYDYNNKTSREYIHPTEGLIHAPTARERNGPCAAENADMEREFELKKQHERERIRAQTDERCRKALEREQARRDCVELTEKLDALTQQYPQLINPTDPRIQNYQSYVRQTELKEQKRNEAVKELLLRPAIITCPEIDEEQKTTVGPKRPTSTTDEALNIGSPHSSDLADSCGSIILGYVDDQKQKIRKDMQGYATNGNKQKAERLKSLLLRIDDLRKALCEELSKNENGESMQHVINGVSDVRRERERIATKDLLGENGRTSPLGKHLHEVEQKEALLEQKLRELCKMQKLQRGPAKIDKAEGATIKKSGEKECKVQTSSNKPLEIIIKLRNDGTRRAKQKIKRSAKSPRKVSSLIDTPAHRLGVKRAVHNARDKPQQKQQETTQKPINRQNSYDSNSTSYRSLPPRIGNEVDTLVKRLEQDDQVEGNITDSNSIQQSSDASPTNASTQPTKPDRQQARLNPLIAHYVQRLLGMSRNSIRGLGVSSSDIETPTSSVMNVSSNRTLPTVDVSDSQERIQRVQRFIDENRSFISELEDTLRTQSDVTLETSIRMFEEIWQQRLQKEKRPVGDKSRMQMAQQMMMQTKAQRKEQPRAPPSGGIMKRATQNPPDTTVSQPTKVAGKSVRAVAPTSQLTTQKVQSKQQQQRHSTQSDTNPMHLPTTRDTITANATNQQKSRESQNKRDTAVVSEERRAEEQIARYEQLTENCTQRIAELTELIQKVRTEKKRLMEVTLSSVSEGRNSTEYIELPDGTRRRSSVSVDKNTSLSSGGSSTMSRLNAATTQPTTSIDHTPQDTLEQQAAATSAEGISALDSAAPLEKHKPTGISRDSGISISRPMTAQDMEPPSQASTTTYTSNHHSGVRKHRPPPTLQRYSPNFAEDDVAHELSTIIEVDTPATSRVNATTGGAAAAAEVSRSRHLQPQPFPTFEEYAREMNLDVTQLDADTSNRIHQEFETLITNLRNAQIPDYREFPSLSAYLQNLSIHREGSQHCQSPENIEDLISCLRVANLSVKAFPARQDYFRQLANSQSAELLDSASIENVTGTGTGTTNSNTETESESINIEEELRRRQILQHSFRTAKAKEQIFSSTTRDGAEHARAFVAESGIEKLSTTSENASSEFERQLFSLGMKWPATMRARGKEAAVVGSSNTSSSPERVLPTAAAHAQRSSPQRNLNAGVQMSPRRSPDSALREESAKRVDAEKIKATAKEVQFERSVSVRSPTQSPTRSEDRQQLRNSPEGDGTAGSSTAQQAARQKQRNSSPTHDSSSNAKHASRDNKSSRHSPQRSSDCEFLSDFGRPLNLREFLTKELLKHASSSSSSTPTDDSLRSAFLQSIIDTMTPRTNNGGSNQLDRQKTSTPVTHSASSNHQSSGDRSGSSSGNTPSQLFSGESCISSVRFFERSITRNYPRNAPPGEVKREQSTADGPQNEAKK